MKDVDMIAKVSEAIEEMNRWVPVYKAVLKVTGSKEDAIAVIKWIRRMEKEDPEWTKGSWIV